jgi:diacylglycerol kinase
MASISLKKLSSLVKKNSQCYHQDMLKHTISFKNAFTGIWTAITTQANIRIHFFIASAMIGLSVYFEVTHTELLVVILTIALVMIAEMVNTAIEFVCDAITLDHNEYIKYAKDVSAGAVLLSAIFATLVGLIIFVPRFI